MDRKRRGPWVDCPQGFPKSQKPVIWGGTHRKPRKEQRRLENEAGMMPWEPLEEGAIRWGD